MHSKQYSVPLCTAMHCDTGPCPMQPTSPHELSHVSVQLIYIHFLCCLHGESVREPCQMFACMCKHCLAHKPTQACMHVASSTSRHNTCVLTSPASAWTHTATRTSYVLPPLAEETFILSKQTLV